MDLYRVLMKNCSRYQLRSFDFDSKAGAKSSNQSLRKFDAVSSKAGAHRFSTQPDLVTIGRKSSKPGARFDTILPVDFVKVIRMRVCPGSNERKLCSLLALTDLQFDFGCRGGKTVHEKKPGSIARIVETRAVNCGFSMY